MSLTCSKKYNIIMLGTAVSGWYWNSTGSSANPLHWIMRKTSNDSGSFAFAHNSYTYGSGGGLEYLRGHLDVVPAATWKFQATLRAQYISGAVPITNPSAASDFGVLIECYWGGTVRWNWRPSFGYDTGFKPLEYLYPGIGVETLRFEAPVYTFVTTATVNMELILYSSIGGNWTPWPAGKGGFGICYQGYVARA